MTRPQECKTLLLSSADTLAHKNPFQMHNAAINPITLSHAAKEETIVPTTWNADSLKVKRLPMYYKLEKHHAVFDQTELPAVLERLEKLFCKESLMVEYCDGSASSPKTVSARCASLDGVEFAVLIWEIDNEYAVEVQRTAGDSLLFSQHQYAQRVLDTVKNVSKTKYPDDDSAIDPLASRTNIPWSPYDLLQRQIQVTADQQQDALNIVLDLLQSERYDAVQCGLESLVAMTDVSKSGNEQARFVSRIVLSDASSSNVVVSLACFGRFPSPRFDDRSITKYHQLTALTVLAQAVHLVEITSAEVSDFLNQRSVVMMDALLSAVSNARQAPHAAYLATHILAKLCALPDCRCRLQQHLDTLYHAEHVGKCSHAALATASHRLLEALSAT